MQYKTIVLELLEQRTELHEQLRQHGRLLPTMETYADGIEGQPRGAGRRPLSSESGQRPEPDRERSNGTGAQGTGGSFALRVHRATGNLFRSTQAMAFIQTFIRREVKLITTTAESFRLASETRPTTRQSYHRPESDRAPADAITRPTRPFSSEVSRPTPAVPLPAAKRAKPATSSPPSAR